LPSFTVFSFNNGYTLGNEVVRWFSVNWTLSDKKNRKKFQQVLNGFPDCVDARNLWKRDQGHDFIKTPDSKRKFIGFLQSMKTIRRPLFPILLLNINPLNGNVILPGAKDETSESCFVKVVAKRKS
jgi:hypothetical protein